jgi:hypothetical protein
MPITGFLKIPVQRDKIKLQETTWRVHYLWALALRSGRGSSAVSYNPDCEANSSARPRFAAVGS